jgi:hypothetical protein
MTEVTMEGDQEIVKRSGRDEPVWIVKHKCKETRISLHSYLYLKLAKMLCLSYYLFCFLFNKIGEEGRTILPGSEVGGGKGAGGRG